jgi:hypothetical protein
MEDMLSPLAYNFFTAHSSVQLTSQCGKTTTQRACRKARWFVSFMLIKNALYSNSLH